MRYTRSRSAKTQQAGAGRGIIFPRCAKTNGAAAGEFHARGKVLVWLLLCLSGLVSAPRLGAQVTTTTMMGTVTDKSGAVLAGAQVTATNTDTNLSRTVQANDLGEYRIEFLPVGNYRVEVTAEGFKKFVQKGIVLAINETARVDATLDVGSVSETVTVTAGLPLVNTSNAEIGRTVENAEITNLPIVNRNVYDLLPLTAGVQSSTNNIVLGYPEQRTFIHGGVDGGAGSVSYYLDGGTNMTGTRNTGNILPNPDAIQEFRVETNNYNAEYGRMSGGVVTVITKSGTNQFHGSLFEFWRNDKLNANDWGFLSRSPLHRNQFGGTLGGPIREDKTFFFFSYQGLRQVTSALLTGATVPTALERAGNFSQTVDSSGNPVTIFVPAKSNFTGQMTGQSFHCNVANGSPTSGPQTANVICPAFLDPAAVSILTHVPPANVGTSGWQGSVPSPFKSDDFLIKVDHSLNANQRLTFSYFETAGNNAVVPSNSTTGLPTGNLPWSVQHFNWRQHIANVSHTWIVTPALVNQAWLTYTRNFGGRLNLADASMPNPLPPQTSLGDLGSKFTIQGTPSLPNIDVSGFLRLAQANAGPKTGTNFYGVREVATYTHGRHALRFGAEVSLDKDIQQADLSNWGSFNFTAPNNTQNTKNALANFELGLPTTIQQDAPVTGYTNSWSIGFFAQDDFRIFRRLTINLGLRWDIQTPPTDPLNRESTFVPGVKSTVNPNAPMGELFPGDPGVTRGIVPVRWHHVSPRIGLAWDPFGDGKTSIRAGAGIFYGSVSGNEWNTTTNFEPFAIRLMFPGVGALTGPTLGNPYQGLAGGDPFPYKGAFVPGGPILGIAKNFQWPYSYQVNFSVQRQITSDFSMSVAYIGTYSHDLPFATDLNYPLLVSAGDPNLNPPCSGNLRLADTSNVICRRPIDNPNPGSAPSPFGQVQAVQSNQTASYNGLQVTAIKRMGHHFMLNGFYTYSKTLDSVQLHNNTNMGLAQNFANLAEDRGRADFDFRHMFVTSLTWQLEYYHGGSGALRGVLNGWSLSPIVTLRSGQPFTVLNGTDANLDAVTTDRASLTGLDPRSGNCPPRAGSPPGTVGSPVGTSGCWFNTSAFRQNPATPGAPIDGNSPRNFLDGPGFRNVDLAVFRDFKFRERFTLQGRLEARNAFNMVSLDNPNATAGARSLGTITRAKPMRQLQLGLRLTF